MTGVAACAIIVLCSGSGPFAAGGFGAENCDRKHNVKNVTCGFLFSGQTQHFAKQLIFAFLKNRRIQKHQPACQAGIFIYGG
jgi:hypothetical protein